MQKLASRIVLACAFAATSAASVRATLVVVEYVDRNGVGGFPENGGPHWSGLVDTVANTLTISSWTDLPGTPEFWTPALTSFPLVWPAVSATGTPYDVPDSFLGQIDGSFAFISPVSARLMAWNQGEWGHTPSFQLPPEIDFYPGWGGVRKPVSVAGVVVMTFDTSANEREMPLLPISALGLAASIGATVTAFATSGVTPVGAESVPEASALLLGSSAMAVASLLWRVGNIRRRKGC